MTTTLQYSLAEISNIIFMTPNMVKDNTHTPNMVKDNNHHPKYGHSKHSPH